MPCILKINTSNYLIGKHEKNETRNHHTFFSEACGVEYSQLPAEDPSPEDAELFNLPDPASSKASESSEDAALTRAALVGDRLGDLCEGLAGERTGDL